jgi:pentatricopeptide repeat protein
MTKQGENLTISAELVDAEQDRQMWGKQYERKLSDVNSLQSDITRDITDNLKLHLSGSQLSRLAQRETANSQAYQLYLRGRYYWNKRTAESGAKAIEYFQQAIELDPAYALAYSGLADAYSITFFNDLTFSQSESAAKSRAAASKALELDPSLAEAHASMGNVLVIFDWDFKGAEAEFRQALAANPGYASNLQWYAEVLGSVGRYDEALAMIRRAHEADPFSLIINATYGLILSRSGRAAEAHEQFQKTFELERNFPRGHFHFGRALAHEGKYEEAIKEFDQVLQLVPESPGTQSMLAYCYARSGRIEEARKILGKLIEQAKTEHASWRDVAGIYAGLGEKDHAFAALELAFQRRESRLSELREHESLEPLHSDPRFSELLKKVGLPPLN